MIIECEMPVSLLNLELNSKVLSSDKGQSRCVAQEMYR